MRARLRAAAAAAAGLLAAAWLALRLWPYPGLEAFMARPYSLVVLDRRGDRLASLAVGDGIRRERVSLGDLPRRVVDRVIEAEDRRFYWHPGVDPLSLARAALQGLGSGRVVSGASTIAMQLARIVTPRGRSLGGKLLECVDALRLEARLGKRGVLELYLSNVPYGRGAEGVESAAFAYFGKRASELGDYEAALLAALPRGPSRLDPAADPAALADAALRVFYRGPLGKGASPEALRASFLSAAGGSSRGAYTMAAPHFVRDALVPAWEGLASGEGSARGAAIGGRPSAARRRQGRPGASGAWASAYSALSSIDPAAQSALEAALKDGVAGWEDSRLTNGAGLVLDAHTGEILAWAGSVDFFDEAERGQMDGVLAKSQPGSCLKPFLYALALDRGFSPATVLPDIPLEFGASEVYIPLNFNNRYNGPVRLRVALASSLNVPAVYALNRLGVRSFVDYLESLGFESLAGQRDAVGVGLALGNAEVTLLELTRGFSAFARGGTPVAVTPFALGGLGAETASGQRAGGKRGSGAADGQARGGPMSAYAAGAIRSILSDPASRFAGFGEGKAFDVDYEAIFKTGTANQYQHVWALGATADHVVGVWMGNFKGETIIGRTGSGIPAKAVVRVLDALTEAGASFPPLAGVETARICALSGGLATERCPAAVDEVFRPGELPGPCAWHAEGRAEPVFPPEYAAWLSSGGRVGDIEAEPALASIARPKDGAVFWLDPAKPASDQAITIQAVASSAPGVSVLHDGIRLSGGSAGRYLVPAAKGSHEVLLVVDGAVVDKARYEVR